jgi:hypothetical protein
MGAFAECRVQVGNRAGKPEPFVRTALPGGLSLLAASQSIARQREAVARH